MKHIQLTKRRLAFYWNAFLFKKWVWNCRYKRQENCLIVAALTGGSSISLLLFFFSYLLYVTTQRKSLKRNRRRKRRKSCPRILILSGTAHQATIQHFQISNHRKKTRQQMYPECGRNPNPDLNGLHCPMIRFVFLWDKIPCKDKRTENKF